MENIYDLDGKDQGAAVVDMAQAIQEKRAARITPDFVVHTTEVRAAILESIETRKTLEQLKKYNDTAEASFFWRG